MARNPRTKSRFHVKTVPNAPTGVQLMDLPNEIKAAILREVFATHTVPISRKGTSATHPLLQVSYNIRKLAIPLFFAYTTFTATVTSEELLACGLRNVEHWTKCMADFYHRTPATFKATHQRVKVWVDDEELPYNGSERHLFPSNEVESTFEGRWTRDPRGLDHYIRSIFLSHRTPTFEILPSTTKPKLEQPPLLPTIALEGPNTGQVNMLSEAFTIAHQARNIMRNSRGPSTIEKLSTICHKFDKDTLAYPKAFMVLDDRVRENLLFFGSRFNDTWHETLDRYAQPDLPVFTTASEYCANKVEKDMLRVLHIALSWLLYRHDEAQGFVQRSTLREGSVGAGEPYKVFRKELSALCQEVAGWTEEKAGIQRSRRFREPKDLFERAVSFSWLLDMAPRRPFVDFGSCSVVPGTVVTLGWMGGSTEVVASELIGALL